MQTLSTSYGTFYIYPTPEGVFEQALSYIVHAAQVESLAAIGLSGGSTPQQWFKWMVSQGAPSVQLLPHILWMVSDERCVPLSDNQSNFGNVQRFFLDPANIAASHRLPWPVDLPPEAAAARFCESFEARLGKHAGLDVCFLGLGEDGHTASLWPNCPLITSKECDVPFAATYWPERGHRLTITPVGLSRAKRIALMALGAGKKAALQSILTNEFNPLKHPAQLLKNYAHRVSWLVDEAAMPVT